ncbi:hypothetical protein [Aeromonas veronii]|uniref:hypothetical protein n=1 Tax=Aeromonas veronii TaxID=654 RepID=UPI0038B5C0F3
MEITPYKNGIHSLAKGLKCLQEFLDNSEDAYLMKEVILNTHHGLETLFKDLLFQRNPIFLLVDKTTVGQILEFYKGFYDSKNDFIFDDAKTITPDEAIKRIKSLNIINDINDKDYNQLSTAFQKLNAVRNQLQHFAIKANPDSIIRVLGNLIPRAVSLLDKCYTANINNQYYSRISFIPHQALPGMERLFNQNVNINNDLASVYPESINLIGLLERKYDSLLNEAISNFKGKIINKLPINIKINDIGHCGAPPYHPEITLEGWMNEHFIAHRNSSVSKFTRGGEKASAFYDSSLTVEKPEILKWHDSRRDTATLKLKISSDSNITITTPESFLEISQLNEYIPFIKEPKVNILLNLECLVEGMFNEHHLNIETILNLNGNIKIELSSLIYGDNIGAPTIIGTQTIKLNAINTSLNFHAFVQSNYTLSENHSLKLQINESENLIFK